MPPATPGNGLDCFALPQWSVVLRALREARGITRAGWAARLGYSPKTVQRWERGLTVPDAAAEAALVALSQETGAFRRYDHGPLQGLTVTAAGVTALLAEARLATTAAAPRPDGFGSTFPRPLTDLLGRESELAELLARVGRRRLVTLTGSGGTGKTRLAIAVAEAARASFPDDVYFVDLAPLHDPAFVPAAVAQVLGIQEPPGVSLSESITRAVHNARLLLVLDNIEHLPAAAPFVADLLQGTLALSVLVTSRTSLHLHGEQAYSLAPLPPPPAGTTSLDGLAGNPAVALFVQRAQAVRPDFRLTDENGAAVAAVCRRLDGLPLALELAAAWVKLLPPAALLERLAQPLEVLTTGPRDAPARQQTLRATLRWSYGLLTAAGQRLFRRLAVFSGGFTVAVATTICAAGETEAAVLAGIATLLDQGLLVQRAGTSVEPRFGMLETVRAFAVEQLGEGRERAVVRRRHAMAIVAAVEAFATGEADARSEPMATGLDGEQAEVRAVLEWALELGTTDAAAAALGLRLFCTLNSWYHDRAPTEGIRWGRALVALDGARPWPALRAAALYHTAVLDNAYWTVSPSASFPVAGPLLEECRALYQELGDTRGLGLTLATLGGYAQLGERGRELQEDAVTLLRALGDENALATALTRLGITTGRWRGDHRRAQAALQEALAIQRRLRRPAAVAWALLHLGAEACRHHAFGVAIQHLEESVARMRVLGGGWPLVRALNALGQALGEVDEPRALSVFGEVLALGEVYGPPQDLNSTLAGVALLAARRGGAFAAVQLWAAVAVGAGETQVPLFHPDYQATRAAAYAALSEAATGAAIAAGEALSATAAIELGRAVVAELQAECPPAIDQSRQPDVAL